MVINWQFPDGGLPQNPTQNREEEFLLHLWHLAIINLSYDFSHAFSSGFPPWGPDPSPEDVTSEEGRAWRVMRRFNDFWQLKEQLGSSARKLPGAPFPRPGVFGEDDLVDNLWGLHGLTIRLRRWVRSPHWETMCTFPSLSL